MTLSGDMLVLGLGRSGAATARYMLSHAAEGVRSVTVLDEDDDARLRPLAVELEELGAHVELAVHATRGRYDLAVASPGISPERSLFTTAEQASDRMISEIEFAYRESHSPWIAVTGTNGKTTTTSLIAHLLAADVVSYHLVGNVGRPAIQVVSDATPATALVAEVSSFQLALTERFCPRVSVLLNLTPDHLDWHGSMEGYVTAKMRIFANQGPDDTAVIDVDDPGSAAVVDDVAASGVNVVRVSRTRMHPGGASVVDGTLALDTPHGALALVKTDELRIRGAHNVSNALAAAAAAHAFGVPAESIRAGLRTFEPIEHRLEPAGEVGGVEYFNDSKATNPDAVLKALTAFEGRPLVVLLGGRNKGNDFRPLAQEAARCCRAAVLFGEAKGELAEAFRGVVLDVVEAATLAEAVRLAAGLACPGDAVVLSPACASFDEFSGYEERGRVFRSLVSAMSQKDPGGET